MIGCPAAFARATPSALISRIRHVLPSRRSAHAPRKPSRATRRSLAATVALTRHVAGHVANHRRHTFGRAGTAELFADPRQAREHFLTRHASGVEERLERI